MVELPIDPPISKEKCYIFTCECLCEARFSVWAKNLEEAEDRLKAYDRELEEVYDIEVDEIISYEIEE